MAPADAPRRGGAPERLRVLIVSHGHPELSRGGAEVASYLLFQGLRDSPGIDAVYLARTDDPEYRSEAIFAPFRGRADELVFYNDTVDPFLFSQRSAAFVTGFLRLLDRLAPDIVHFHHYATIGLELISAAREARPQTRIFVTLHEYLAICNHFGQMVKTGGAELCRAAHPTACARCFPALPAVRFAERERFIKTHFRKIDRFIAPSRFLQRRYVEWGLPSWQTTVIDNGIRPAPAAPAPRPLRPGERRGTFGFFGQITPFKGLTPLLMAFDIVTQLPEAATRDIRLVIHGAYLELNAPAYVADFRRLLARTAARVEFAGPYAPGDLPRLMGAVDWVVVPSVWWENSPVVIQEAFAHRRPVICGNIGGMAEKVRHGLDGFHLPVGDPVALADLMIRLAADPEVWNRLQQTIQPPQTVAQSVPRHLELYRDDSFGFAPAPEQSR